MNWDEWPAVDRPVVKIMWQAPPEESNGHWFRRYSLATLPLDIAEDEERAGRCTIVRVNGEPVPA